MVVRNQGGEGKVTKIFKGNQDSVVTAEQRNNGCGLLSVGSSSSVLGTAGGGRKAREGPRGHERVSKSNVGRM